MKIFLAFLMLIVLVACSSDKSAQYWQRITVSDSAYQQGPKAQEMLNRDIAACVAELKEMERLGTVRDAIPADSQGRVLSGSEEAFMRHETPEKFGGLNMEHGKYHDFEGCMLSKGWERVKHVPYGVASTARDTYLKSVDEYEYYSRFGYREDRSGAQKTYGNLNQ